jgi:hypothetical protein
VHPDTAGGCQRATGVGDRGCGLAIGLACLWTLAVPPPVTAQSLGYSSSVYVAGSAYEGVRTTSVYLFQSVDVAAGPVRISASVPIVRQRIESEADTVSPAEVSSGFGDPLIRVDIRVVDDRPRGVLVTLAASVKPAMVEAASGLGTGAADFALGASAFHARGRTSVFADALFWKYGDPEGVDFDNAVSYSVGIGRIIGSGRWSTSVALSGFSPVAEAPPPVLVSVGAMLLTGPGQSLAVTAGFGLSDTASDFSIGTSWRIQV